MTIHTTTSCSLLLNNPVGRAVSGRREAVAVLLTGVAHLFFEEVLGAKWVFMLFAFLTWSVYLSRQVQRERAVLKQWGLCQDNLGVTFVVTGIAFSIGTAGIIGLALSRGTFVTSWHIFPLLVAYPVWGLIQQFLIQVLVVRNLTDGVVGLRAPWRVTPIAASLFALAHWPDGVLMGATFLLGVAFTPVYLR